MVPYAPVFVVVVVVVVFVVVVVAVVAVVVHALLYICLKKNSSVMGECQCSYTSISLTCFQTLGNLEFAKGLDVLNRFLEDVNFDVVSANINATLEPELEALFNKSTVFEFDGQKVGIVGYAHEALNTIAILGMFPCRII